MITGERAGSSPRSFRSSHLYTPDQIILDLQDRRCALETERVRAVEHLNCLRGGIAEIDLQIVLWQQKAAEAATPLPAPEE